MSINKTSFTGLIVLEMFNLGAPGRLNVKSIVNCNIKYRLTEVKWIVVSLRRSVARRVFPFFAVKS